MIFKKNEYIYFASFLAAISCICFEFYSAHSINHDSSWYIVSTRMFLSGYELYDEIIEINPPLAFYVIVPSIFIERLLEIDGSSAFIIYVLFLCSLSAFWAFRIAIRSGLIRLEVSAIISCIVASNFFLFIHEFGQREHFLIIFASPYFLYLIFNHDSRFLSRFEVFAIGLFAFFGLALKPFFLIIPFAIIASRYLFNKSVPDALNYANLSIGGLVVAYLVFIFIRHPLYFEYIVPMARMVYFAYEGDFFRVILRPEFFSLFFLMIIFFKFRGGLGVQGVLIVSALIGSLFSYLIQFKGWNYQVLPTSFFIILAATWILVRAWPSSCDKLFLVSFASTVFILSFGIQLTAGPYRSLTTEEFRPYVVRKDTAIMVMSSNVSAAFPFINDVGARWTSRYPTLWVLPGAIRAIKGLDCSKNLKLCLEYERIISDFSNSVVQDFIFNKPELVFVDDRKEKSYFSVVDFDYIEFFSKDPVFHNFWRQYKQVGRVLNYTIWVRSE